VVVGAAKWCVDGCVVCDVGVDEVGDGEMWMVLLVCG